MKLITNIPDELFSIFKKHGIMAFDYLNEYDKDQIAIAIAHGAPYGSCRDCRKYLEEETHPDCFDCSHHYRNKFEPKECEV